MPRPNRKHANRTSMHSVLHMREVVEKYNDSDSDLKCNV